MNTYAYWRLSNDVPRRRNESAYKRTYAVRLNEAGDVTGACGPLDNGVAQWWPHLLPSYAYDSGDPYHTTLDYVITHAGDFRQVGRLWQA